MTLTPRHTARPARHSRRRARADLAIAAGLAGLALAAGAAPYRCTLTNGRSVVSAQNLAHTFPAGVESCVSAEDLASAPAPRLAGKVPRVLWAAPLEGTAAALDDLLPAPALLRAAPTAALSAGVSNYDELIAATSALHGVDPDLARAVMQAESAGKARALSNKGAIGLMQIMPGTGARYGVGNPSDLYRPEINIDAGIRYLRDLVSMFKGRLDLVVAAYNAGEGAVMRHGMSIPPYAETREYVRRVLGLYDRLVATRASRRGLQAPERSGPQSPRL